MTNFEQGFIDKCAEHGVNAEELLKEAAGFSLVKKHLNGTTAGVHNERLNDAYKSLKKLLGKHVATAESDVGFLHHDGGAAISKAIRNVAMGTPKQRNLAGSYLQGGKVHDAAKVKATLQAGRDELAHQLQGVRSRLHDNNIIDKLTDYSM